MKVTFLGLGIMGSRMAANLFDKGFELTVWNRTSSVATEFAQKRPGVRVAHTPREAGEGAELVLTMVVDGPQVRSILLSEDGAATNASEGTLFVDCSTIGPTDAVEIAGELHERGFEFLDAPVTGSSPRAEAGTLVIMVGGPRAQFERALPALEAMGTTIVHAGESGQGQLVKVINNAVAAVNATTLGQALLVGSKLGVDLDSLVSVMADGSAASTMVDLKAQPMLRHEYPTMFKLDHMLKDVRFCLQTASAAGAAFPYAEQTEQVLREGSELGFGEQDFAALIEALERRTNQRL